MPKAAAMPGDEWNLEEGFTAAAAAAAVAAGGGRVGGLRSGSGLRREEQEEEQGKGERRATETGETRLWRVTAILLARSYKGGYAM